MLGESQGGAANSTRPRTTNLGIKVSSSPVVQHEENEAHRGSGYCTRRLESMKKRATAVALNGKIEMSREGMSTKRSEPRREDRDEHTMRVSEESLEMSLVRGCDARSRHEQAGKTPPIPQTGRSAKGGNGRVVSADHEALGQRCSDGCRSHKSQTCACDT